MLDLGNKITNKFLMTGTILCVTCVTDSALLEFDFCGVGYNGHRTGLCFS